MSLTTAVTAIEYRTSAVVDEALGAQDGHLATGQRTRQYADGGGVGRRQGSSQHPRRSPCQPERVSCGSNRGCGHDDQDGAQKHDAAKVPTDLTERGRQAFPEQDHGQEHEQDSFWR